MNTEGSAGGPVVAQVVRMSLRPPPRFAPGTDLDLWITRFEMYLKQANTAEDQWTVKLLPMLDDEPFRTVLRQRLSASSQYKAVIECLRTRYAPDSNKLEWQFKLQNRMQKPGEQLVEFVGALRALAEKAYPTWPDEQIKELLRNQFIQGLQSSLVQLELMKEKPSTLDEAVQLANWQESIKAAQRRPYREQNRLP